MAPDETEGDPDDLRGLFREMLDVVRTNASAVQATGLVPEVLDTLLALHVPLASDDEITRLPIPRVEIRWDPSSDPLVTRWRLSLVVVGTSGGVSVVGMSQSEAHRSTPVQPGTLPPLTGHEEMEARSLMRQLQLPGFLVVGDVVMPIAAAA